MNGFNLPQRKLVCLKCGSDEPEYRRYCVKCMIEQLDRDYPSFVFNREGGEPDRMLALAMQALMGAGWNPDEYSDRFIKRTSRVAKKLCSTWQPKHIPAFRDLRSKVYGDNKQEDC